MSKKLIYAFLLVIFIIPENSFAIKKVAQSKMQFIKLGVSARAVAMGDAFTGISGDPNSIFYNPAGCAFIKGISIAFNQANWIADIKHTSATISYNAKRYGVVNLNYITMDYGSMERTIVDAHAWEGYLSKGEFSVSEYAIGLGYAHQITDRLALGGQIKYISQDLGSNRIWRYIGSQFENTKIVENKDDVVAYDFGTFYYTGFKGLTIAMAIQNFANKAIPLNFRFGMAINLNEVIIPNSQNNTIVLDFDVLHPRDYSERAQLGIEYGFRRLFFLRMGYKLNYDEEDFSAGVGVNLTMKGLLLKVDYAYTNFGILGNVNRFSISISRN